MALLRALETTVSTRIAPLTALGDAPEMRTGDFLNKLHGALEIRGEALHFKDIMARSPVHVVHRGKLLLFY